MGKLTRAFSRAVLRLPDGECVVETIHGLKIIVDPGRGRGLEAALYCDGVYEEGTLDVMARVLRPGDVFIDVGANIGLMSLWAATCVGTQGQVYAFEPLPCLVQTLERNCQLNSIQNVVISQCAVAAVPGTYTIRENPQTNRGNASLIWHQDVGPGLTIPATSLDEFVKDRGLLKVRLVKIDVEGYELECLRGATRLIDSADPPILCVECTPMMGRDAAADLFQFLTGRASYQVFRLKRSKSDLSRLTEIRHPSELPEHDNLFCFSGGHTHLLDELC
jgi:FkbM family methyltransferase